MDILNELKVRIYPFEVNIVDQRVDFNYNSDFALEVQRDRASFKYVIVEICKRLLPFLSGLEGKEINDRTKDEIEVFLTKLNDEMIAAHPIYLNSVRKYEV